MDYRHIFSGPGIAQEFLDRFPQLAGGGLEGVGSLEHSIDDASKAVRAMQENTGEAVDPGLEAIILKFGRPAYFVQTTASPVCPPSEGPGDARRAFGSSRLGAG